MRLKTFLLLVVAVSCGLIAAFAVNQMGRPDPTMVDVPIPKADIGPGTILDVKNQFMSKPYPRGLVPPNVITDLSKLEGKVPARTLSAHMPVTERDLINPTAIARDLEVGYRAMTVRANIENSMHGMLLPGARVDVLTITRDSKNSQQSESKIFLQNIKILAVNAISDQPEGKNAVPNVASITMMVQPNQAQRLFLVSSRGQVGIALRKPGDIERVEVVGISDPLGNDPLGDDAALVQVAVAVRNIEPGVFINRFDEYFKLIPVPRTQLIDQPILDRGQIEGQRLCRFIARGQPAMPVNFLFEGVLATDEEFEQTIQNGPVTHVYKFRSGLPLPAGKKPASGPDDARNPDGGEN